MLMYVATLASALIFQLVFLHNSDTWLLKVSLKSNLTPKSFSHLLFTTLKSSIFILTSSFTLNSKWHLLALLLKRLSLNHLNKVFEAFYIVSSNIWCIVSQHNFKEPSIASIFLS